MLRGITRGVIAAVGFALAGIGPADAGYIFAFDVPGGNHLTTDGGDAFTINSGWYLQTAINSGRHDSTNPSYEVGTDEFPDDVFRNFFIFDISKLIGPVTSASFTVNTAETWLTGDGTPSTLLSLFDVSTSIADLEATNSNRGDIWSDLGSGLLYGTRIYTDADASTFKTIILDAELVGDLNLAIENKDGLFAIGGRLDPTPTDIPESSSLALLVAGLAGVWASGRKRISAQAE